MNEAIGRNGKGEKKRAETGSSQVSQKRKCFKPTLMYGIRRLEGQVILCFNYFEDSRLENTSVFKNSTSFFSLMSFGKSVNEGKFFLKKF